ncbi:rod shape-determining protein [Sphingobium sp. CFD-2]|uniref:rod shape-determining protein n=1 Tax=Sphingobium sp. CFD-2 TaxID=2878542 RepID=UPI0027D456F5|nr:rod shape-determining protein [Sphingobium sp. CFD-2]
MAGIENRRPASSVLDAVRHHDQIMDARGARSAWGYRNRTIPKCNLGTMLALAKPFDCLIVRVHHHAKPPGDKKQKGASHPEEPFIASWARESVSKPHRGGAMDFWERQRSSLADGRVRIRDKRDFARYSARMVSFISWKRPELAIDFGTANLRVIHRDGGIVFDEPSLCCFADFKTAPRLVAAGRAAQAMVDRTPGGMEVKRPLRRGVLQDIFTATELLCYAVPRALGRKRLGKASAVIGVPADATQAERSALLTAASDAGLDTVRLVPEPFAAAVGAGIDVQAPHGSLIVECGAGITEVAVISLGGTCLARSVRLGGAALDQAISDHLHFRHKMLIGRQTAERIKKAYVEQRDAGGTIEVKGRSLLSMRPGFVQIAAAELDRVMEKHAARIVEIILDALNETPPELSHDLHLGGILLTGGSAVTPRLSAMIERHTGLPVMVADDAALCVAQGLSRILDG